MELSAATEMILDVLELAGGRPYLVGGCVRDSLLGLQSKDVDIECFGLPADVVRTVLSDVWDNVDEVGQSFGVLKLRIGAEEFDISLPRREVKTGEGYTGFSVQTDPYMPVEAALGRRDFTINAMAWNRSEGLVDFYGGVEDLEAGRLRPVSSAFAEDPLRVLRGVQFAARFGMLIVPSAVHLCRKLLSEAHTIASERILVEYVKILRKGKYVHLAQMALRETGWDSVLRVPLDRDAALRLVGARERGVTDIGLLTAAFFGGSLEGVAFGRSLRFSNADQRRLEAASESWDVRLSGRAEGGALSRKLWRVGLTLSDLGAARGEFLVGPQDGPEPLSVTGAMVVAAGVPEGPMVGKIVSECAIEQGLGGHEMELFRLRVRDALH